MIEPNPGNASWEFSADDLAIMTKSVEITASVFGAVRNCIHVDSVDANLLLDYRVEFHSVDAANRAVQSLRADPVWGMSNEVCNNDLFKSHAHSLTAI